MVLSEATVILQGWTSSAGAVGWEAGVGWETDVWGRFPCAHFGTSAASFC